MAQKNQTIKFVVEKPHIIVCEGIDDKNFLEAYLKYLSKSEKFAADLFNVIEMQGVDNITKLMKTYRNYDNYDEMKSFLFIRDADQDVQRAVESLRGNIRDVWQINLDKTGDFKQDSDGKYFGFYIFPRLNEDGEYQNGTLEDLCSEIFYSGDEKLSTLVETHLQAVEDTTKIKFKMRHKNKLHLLFGSTNEFVGYKIGEAARDNAFDFANDKLKNLKAKLFAMLNFE